MWVHGTRRKMDIESVSVRGGTYRSNEFHFGKRLFLSVLCIFISYLIGAMCYYSIVQISFDGV